jgi:ribosomal subunit interface protein
MQVTVSGKGIDVGDALRSHIEARLEERVNKYLDRVPSVSVIISRESHMFRADIHGNTGTHSNVMIKSHDENDDVYAAFDGACEKIEKQLRRYKRRLTSHHKAEGVSPEREELLFRATKYVLEDHEDDKIHSVEDAPVVIAEKAADLEKLTVSAAVMKMDLADLPALMFINASNGRLNVVYRRRDGNISWVDPVTQALAA